MKVVYEEQWPPESWSEFPRLMIIVWTPVLPELPLQLAPLDVVKVNGQPLVVQREVGLVEYRQRVLEANLPHWLGAPLTARYYEVTSD